jgi:serine/threonine protein kinase
MSVPGLIYLEIPPIEIDESTRELLLGKVITLSENYHPATQKLISLSFDSSSDTPREIVTEFFPNGNLDQAVKNERTGNDVTLNGTTKSKLIFGIVSGMCSLHARGIVHHYLRLQNVFLIDRYEPIIAGFDLSRPFNNRINDLCDAEPSFYRAPELHGSDIYDFSADIYSFAITLYGIFTDLAILDDTPRPIRSPMEVIMRIAKGARFVKRPEIPEYH